MQVAIVRTEYVDVPDNLVVVVKAWMRQSQGEPNGVPKVSIIKAIREATGWSLKEAKDTMDAIFTQVTEERPRVW